MAFPHLRLVDQINSLRVPTWVERGAGVLDQTHAEEAVDGLDRRRHDADVRQHAAQQDAPDAPLSQPRLEVCRRKGPEGPLVHDDLAVAGAARVTELIARVADQIVPDGRAVAVRPRVRDREPRGARRLE